MHVPVLCEDLLGDFITKSKHVRELMECSTTILMDDFFPKFSGVFLVTDRLTARRLEQTLDRS